MGFMKQGISIMAMFWGMIFVASYLNIGPVLFMLPILWCYSFFHAQNLRGMPDEEFYAVEDEYLFQLEAVFSFKQWGKKQTNILAVILIIAGGAVLWNHFTAYMSAFLPDWLYWYFVRNIPQIIIAVLLILCGIALIRGKKVSLEWEEAQDAGREENPYETMHKWEEASAKEQNVREECQTLTGEVVGKEGKEQ